MKFHRIFFNVSGVLIAAFLIDFRMLAEEPAEKNSGKKQIPSSGTLKDLANFYGLRINFIKPNEIKDDDIISSNGPIVLSGTVSGGRRPYKGTLVYHKRGGNKIEKDLTVKGENWEGIIDFKEGFNEGIITIKDADRRFTWTQFYYFMDNTPPDAPAWVKAYISDDGRGVSLVWPMSSSTDVSRYKVSILDASGAALKQFNVGPAELNYFPVEGLISGQPYTAKIIAYDGMENQSKTATSVSFTPSSFPALGNKIIEDKCRELAGRFRLSPADFKLIGVTFSGNKPIVGVGEELVLSATAHYKYLNPDQAIDLRNGKYDYGEKFVDNGNGIWDLGEKYEDENAIFLEVPSRIQCSGDGAIVCNHRLVVVGIKTGKYSLKTPEGGMCDLFVSGVDVAILDTEQAKIPDGKPQSAVKEDVCGVLLPLYDGKLNILTGKAVITSEVPDHIKGSYSISTGEGIELWEKGKLFLKSNSTKSNLSKEDVVKTFKVRGVKIADNVPVTISFYEKGKLKPTYSDSGIFSIVSLTLGEVKAVIFEND